MRADLSPAERSVHIATRKRIYERLHPETKADVAGAVATNKAKDTEAAKTNGAATVKFTPAAPSFTENTAKNQ